ncbi:hypothetical protein GOARA_013_00610 [Gordonia araii NBRC 100433]|uniref:Uncharacterized protein n=1 Tax=Gordonia araii NBRC 100433 TaxID=1073574 RepID=G7GYE2_9ACTN|nr:DUF5360 family protein [Gordonia araii]NNG97385.1 DUF5360 family protein [Gordonia araii NBRC 100433]GAB08617.1 hypothetical protein GOARA_013_00610 [Gordonia araii NBRC 100433]
MKTRKALLVITDIGLIVYWALTALGIISVGNGEWINAWNWSFFPLDLLAIIAGLMWSLLPKKHRWATPMYATALAFTHAAGLMAISFFVLYGTWDASWWLVNLWLALMPIGLAVISMRKRPDELSAD